MQIAVAGGTGWLGRLVVEAAQEGGHTTAVISRATGVDLTTGTGLARVLEGAEAVIDVSNVTTVSAKKSIGFFTAATGHLIESGRAAGVRHHVAVSIIGVDRVGFGYYQGKLRQEQLVLDGAVGASVLRAAQFHEFAAQMVERFKGPFVPVPRMLSQPVAAREVAQALVRLAEQEPVGLAPDLAGPEELEMSQMVRRLLKARGSTRLVIGLPMPGKVGKQMAGGGLLPTSPGPRGTQTYAEWLAESR